MQAITVGLDIAKSVFQVHGVDADGQVVIRRRLKRRNVLAFFEKLTPCLIGIGASTAPTCMALACRWRSRPQHQ
jgi:transposase